MTVDMPISCQRWPTGSEVGRQEARTYAVCLWTRKTVSFCPKFPVRSIVSHPEETTRRSHGTQTGQPHWLTSPSPLLRQIGVWANRLGSSATETSGLSYQFRWGLTKTEGRGSSSRLGQPVQRKQDPKPVRETHHNHTHTTEKQPECIPDAAGHDEDFLTAASSLSAVSAAGGPSCWQLQQCLVTSDPCGSVWCCKYIYWWGKNPCFYRIVTE